jgi:predicted short-subunit dehydrogenase-like oxidoreductase (DUF2520 family)
MRAEVRQAYQHAMKALDSWEKSYDESLRLLHQKEELQVQIDSLSQRLRTLQEGVRQLLALPGARGNAKAVWEHLDALERLVVAMPRVGGESHGVPVRSGR